MDPLLVAEAPTVLGTEPTREGKAGLLAELRDRGVVLIDLQPEPFDDGPLRAIVALGEQRLEAGSGASG